MDNQPSQTVTTGSRNEGIGSEAETVAAIVKLAPEPEPDSGNGVTDSAGSGAKPDGTQSLLDVAAPNASGPDSLQLPGEKGLLGQATGDSTVPQHTQSPVTPTPLPAVEEALRLQIREEIRNTIDLRPSDPREFDFKVETVKWFGILCSIVILLILVLDFIFINKIIDVSRAHDQTINFSKFFIESQKDTRLIELGVENEALNMRNKRTVSALYMRAYTQFLSITAGAILALLGAVFVLARVDSRETRSEASWKDFRWLVNTASPGVLIALLGVGLISFVAYRSIAPIEALDTPVFRSQIANMASQPLQQNDLGEDEMNSPAFVENMEKVLEGIRTKEGAD